jgi:hypothetical protein
VRRGTAINRRSGEDTIEVLRKPSRDRDSGIGAASTADPIRSPRALAEKRHRDALRRHRHLMQRIDESCLACKAHVENRFRRPYRRSHRHDDGASRQPRGHGHEVDGAKRVFLADGPQPTVPRLGRQP